MRRFALLIALACCLIGVAAQPASAQQGQWAAARQQRRAMMRARRQAAARAYGAQASRIRRLSARMGRRARAQRRIHLDRGERQFRRDASERTASECGGARLRIRVVKVLVRRMRKQTPARMVAEAMVAAWPDCRRSGWRIFATSRLRSKSASCRTMSDFRIFRRGGSSRSARTCRNGTT